MKGDKRDQEGQQGWLSYQVLLSSHQVHHKVESDISDDVIYEQNANTSLFCIRWQRRHRDVGAQAERHRAEQVH